MHVTIDGRGTINENWSIRGAHAFCIRSIGLAEMTLISGPNVMALRGRIYAHAILAESHVSVQLDKRTSEVFVDMFSCKDFDIDGFELLAQTHFNLEELAVRNIDRGLPQEAAP